MTTPRLSSKTAQHFLSGRIFSVPTDLGYLALSTEKLAPPLLIDVTAAAVTYALENVSYNTVHSDVTQGFLDASVSL